MNLTEALAWLTLVVGCPLNVVAAVLLWREWRTAPKLRVLRERFIVATITAIVVGIFGFIFINNDLVVPPLNVEFTKLLTRSAILALAIIPALTWLYLYFGRGKKK